MGWRWPDCRVKWKLWVSGSRGFYFPLQIIRDLFIVAFLLLRHYIICGLFNVETT
jgi:hypothetical protein